MVITPLFAASCNGRVEAVKKLLDEGANKDVANQDKCTPLYAASCNGHVEVVKVLLNAGANKDAANKDGWTPLIAASAYGHVEVVMELLKAAADKDAANNDWRTPLYMASVNGHVEVVKKLLEEGANKEAASKGGATPLYIASHDGRVEVVKVLLMSGADKNVAKKKGCTPLYAASRHGHVEVVKTLLAEGVDKDVATMEGCTPLITASDLGHAEVVKELLDSGANKDAADNEGQTSLYVAAYNGNVEVVEHLLAAGANKDVATKARCTPLHAASENGHLKVVQKLLAVGANKEPASKEGWTPLFAACVQGHTAVVKELLDAGANKDAANENWCTPLYAASSRGHVAVVEQLVAADADMVAANTAGWTPLDIASAEGHVEVMTVLMNAGANKDANTEGRKPEYAEKYTKHVHAVNALVRALGDDAVNKPLVKDLVYQLYTPSDGQDPSVDIVFFHGLQFGDFTKAWHETWEVDDNAPGRNNQKRERVCWPAVLLPEDFPRARILSVSYAGLALGGSSVDLVGFGQMLVTAFHTMEQPLGRRPLYFVGHSLGGLVIKQVCVELNSCSSGGQRYKEECANILRCLCGTFNFAVPGQGSRMADLLSKVPTAGAVVRVLETLSRESARLHTAYEAIRVDDKTGKRWATAGVGETKATRWGPFTGMVVEEASAQLGLDSYTPVQGADHISICKLSGRDTPAYAILKKEMKTQVPRANWT